MVFAVIFEVQPYTEKWDSYLSHAKALGQELVKIKGFIENIRYGSFTKRAGLLSLSIWENEKGLVRWRTHEKHHYTQEEGRNHIFDDYQLRVGEIYQDSQSKPEELPQQRLDQSELETATAIVLVDGKHDPQWLKDQKGTPKTCAAYLGLKDTANPDLVNWDFFEAILTPGDIILLTAWKTNEAAEKFIAFLPEHASRSRTVRLIREYGKYDRREAPQYYPDVDDGRQTLHAKLKSET
jgi:heme-degrading monooxygenase HmoA